MHEISSIYPSFPLLIASGRGQENCRSLFKDLPLTSVVSKPYTAEELKAPFGGSESVHWRATKTAPDCRRPAGRPPTDWESPKVFLRFAPPGWPAGRKGIVRVWPLECGNL